MKNQNALELLQEIKALLSHNKKVMNVEDLSQYTGLSKSKIYKLTQLNLIPSGVNPHLRQKFFEKDTIDDWLLGKSDSSITGENKLRESVNSKEQ